MNAQGHRANFQLVGFTLGDFNDLTIRDLGPWDQHPTVTNDAEDVLARLHCEGKLPAGRRLYYYDSEGRLDELKHDGQGHFTGFGPGPQEGTR